MRASGPPADVVVSEPDHWADRVPGVDSIIDPMVFRVADRFLEGSTGDDRSDRRAWEAISYNTASIMAFFDLLVFSEQLPLIDYGMTFAPADGYEVAAVYDVVRELSAGVSPNAAPPIVSVHVEGRAHDAARDAAIAALGAHGPVDEALAASIDDELTAFDHAWQPDLTAFDPSYGWDGPDDPARRVATFVYGGLLFAQFAGQAGIPHVLHGKRARLDLAVALDAPTASYEAEAELDARLTEILRDQLARANRWVDGTQALPSVLPYLLARYEPMSPMELVLRALELRATSMAADYRGWKARIVEEFSRTLVVPPELEREVSAAATAIEQTLAPAASGGFHFVLKIVPVPDVLRQRLWSWALSSTPGRSHLKMLYRLQLHDRAASGGDKLRAMEVQLGRLWRAA